MRLKLTPRKPDSYLSVIYQVQALAKVVYSHRRTGGTGQDFMAMVYETAGIIVPAGEDPTLSQLYLVEEYLIAVLNEMHEQTLMLLEAQGRREESA